jgi:ssDNA-binding Zn-finger/Zn-ribbon topoisomerase 1
MLLKLKRGTGMACDCCGKALSHGGRTSFLTAYAAVEAAKCRGWKSSRKSVRDLCDECRSKN